LIEGHDLAALALIDADRDLAAELVALALQPAYTASAYAA